MIIQQYLLAGLLVLLLLVSHVGQLSYSFLAFLPLSEQLLELCQMILLRSLLHVLLLLSLMLHL